MIVDQRRHKFPITICRCCSVAAKSESSRKVERSGPINSRVILFNAAKSRRFVTKRQANTMSNWPPWRSALGREREIIGIPCCSYTCSVNDSSWSLMLINEHKTALGNGIIGLPFLIAIKLLLTISIHFT